MEKIINEDFSLNKYAKIRYDNYGDIIYEDYSKLEKMIDKFLIEKHLFQKHVIDEKTGITTNYPYVTMKYLNLKNLSQIEFDYTMNYLKNKGIKVVGKTSVYAGIYDNYECIGAHGFKYDRKHLSCNETEKMLLEYEKTKDPVLREKIIVGNIQLVEYISSSYYTKYGINIYEIMSYGFEGLIKAVDNFDSSKSTNVSSFFSTYVDNYISNGFRTQIYSQNFGFYNAINKAIAKITNEEPELSYEDPLFIKKVTIEVNKYSKDNMQLYSEEKVKKIMNHYLPVSLDNETVDIEDNKDYFTDINYSIDKCEVQEIIESLKRTSNRNKEIIKMYYGFGLNKPASVEEIAQKFCMNTKNVYRILNVSLKKMCQLPDIDNYRKFLGESRQTDTSDQELRLVNIRKK